MGIVTRHGQALIAATLSVALLTGSPPPAFGESFNSADIVERSVQQDCLDWCVVGACFYVTCGLLGCKVSTRPKIAHNLPDLVVTTYHDAGDSPWEEARNILGNLTRSSASSLLGGLSAGAGQHGEAGRRASEATFNEVQVIGSPVAALNAQAVGVPFLCRSQARPLQPYFLSELDALAWRSAEFEMLHPETWLPGTREIGSSLFQTWGPVYPRTGFTLQPDPPKAAAVTAQRAIDIVTQTSQWPHVYVPFAWDGHKKLSAGNPEARSQTACEHSGGAWSEVGDGQFKCQPQHFVQWLPAGREQTDQWQMLSPHVDTACAPFGQDGDWSTPRQTADERFAFHYWRPYQCCMPGPGRYIGAVATGRYCP